MAVAAAHGINTMPGVPQGSQYLYNLFVAGGGGFPRRIVQHFQHVDFGQRHIVVQPSPRVQHSVVHAQHAVRAFKRDALSNQARVL